MPSSRERDALIAVQRIKNAGGVASAVAVSKILNISNDYAALLCDALARQGYLFGSRLKGYQPSTDGEALFAELSLSGVPSVVAEVGEMKRAALSERVEKLAGDLQIDDFGSLFSELADLRGRLIEEERRKQVEFRCTVGREFARNHWGKLSVFVINNEMEEPISKSKLAKEFTKLPDPQSARLGVWIRYTGRLPAGTMIKIFADGGDKEGRYRKYQEKQEWFFILERDADELTFVGEYAGIFAARMRPLGECSLIRKMVTEPVGERVPVTKPSEPVGERVPVTKPSDLPAFKAPKPPKAPKLGWEPGQWE